MTVLQPGLASPDPVPDDPWGDYSLSPAPHPVESPVDPSREPTTRRPKVIELLERIAALNASRGDWQQAYQHLRSALDLVYSDRNEQPPPVPEQLRREVDRLRREHAEAREQSIRDSLTASYNRRYLDQRLTTLLDPPADTDADGLAVALVDLDRFKHINDTFGHLVGDRVLQRVVELLVSCLPDGAFCARYGGDEFVLVLPGVGMSDAVALCEAARLRIRTYPWSQLAIGLRVTVSVGLTFDRVAGGTDLRPVTSPEQQLLRADNLLYAAKMSGRDAVAYRQDGQVLLAGTPSRRAVAEPWVVGP